VRGVAVESSRPIDQSHVLLGGLSLVLIAVGLSPILLGYQSRPNMQVPVGQKITLSLHNTGVVEHDVTVPGTGFSLLARAGQTATGEFSFPSTGAFDFLSELAYITYELPGQLAL
jgi:heme/copper-type cytochrome/quinol oxidase subunit 2